MFFLKFFETKICSSFIIAHVVIPSLRELQELCFLSSFDILQFLLLSGSDVVFLSDRLFSQELLKLSSGFFSFLIVSFDFTFLSVFFEKSQEIKNFVISGNIYDSIVSGLSDKFLSI